MSQNDIITPLTVARRLPAVLRKLPRMLKGLRITSQSDPQRIAGLGWALEEAVRINPQGVAVLCQDRRLSYAEFNAWANRIAHFCDTQGLVKGDAVAVMIENRPELLAVVAGLAKLGVVAALVNTSQRGRVLAHSINLVAPKAAIVGEELEAALQEVLPELGLPKDSLFWLADNDTLREPGNAPKGYRNLAGEIAGYPSISPRTVSQIMAADGLFYIYTSGTTGLPKAAIFSHGRFMKAYGGFGHTLQLTAKDVIYVTMPFYHATAMVVCWSSALAGAAGIAVRRKFSASEFWNDIRRYDASAFGYVGELCRYLMERPASPDDQKHRAIKMIGNGLRPNIWAPFKERFGIKEVMELYASSEGNVGFTNVFNFDNTVGFSPVTYAVVVYDKEAEEPRRGPEGFMRRVARGESGLLIGQINEKSPFDGYTDNAKNEACILRDVFVKGDRYFNTGDLMRDIGFRHAQFVDRTGDTFRWKGENVSTTEVENSISGFASVQDAVVYGVEIPGTNGRAGMAAITPSAGLALNELDLTNLYTHLKSSLPGYAVPLFLRLRQTTETTGTFKYQKAPLKQAGFDPAQVAGDPLFVLLPGSTGYQPLSQELFDGVCAGLYRF